VQVIDWTAMGAPPPMVTGPTETDLVFFLVLLMLFSKRI